MRALINSIIIAIIATLILTGCVEESTSDQQEDDRDQIMSRAYEQVPTPEVNNFVKREMVAEYMNRMDEPNKTFYIYVIADTGNPIGYYVSRGGPVNICTFMTPPDRRDAGTHGAVRRSAPGLDGVYYGGGGACDTEYFFDAETDAMVQINGMNLFVSDQPLDLDAQPISVRTEEGGN